MPGVRLVTCHYFLVPIYYSADTSKDFQVKKLSNVREYLQSALNSNSTPVTICSEEYDAHVVASKLLIIITYANTDLVVLAHLGS